MLPLPVFSSHRGISLNYVLDMKRASQSTVGPDCLQQVILLSCIELRVKVFKLRAIIYTY
jgi:hypothetical protein